VTRFAYEAFDVKGKVVQGMVDAPNVESAIDSLRTSRFTVTHVKAQVDLGHSIRELRERYVQVKVYPIVVFTRQLATILNSGIPLLRGLECLGNQGIDARLGVMVQAVCRDVRQGMALSVALGRYPQVFSAVYVAMVRAGETTGQLGDILNQLAALTEREYALRRRVQVALTYPIFVLACALIATQIIVSYVFPTFVALLESVRSQLPLPTRALIFVTQVSRNPFFIVGVLAVGVLVIFCYRRFVAAPRGRMVVDRLLLELPVAGLVNTQVCLARFCRTLGAMVGAGIPIQQGLVVVGMVSGNAVLGEVAEALSAALREGISLSQPLRESPFFPPLVHHLVAIGEESGTLPLLLDKIAGFYDVEVENLLRALSSLIEPFVITALGLVVGFVMVAVFMPIYSMLGQIQ
jgi:type IV pilus assembly protein PilC